MFGRKVKESQASLMSFIRASDTLGVFLMQYFSVKIAQSPSASARFAACLIRPDFDF